MKADINRLLELQKLLAMFNQVERVTHRRHGGTYVQENDTEHSYNLAMTSWFLSQWFPELDQTRLITYSLVHDLVETYAGDTYIYGPEADLKSKNSREAKALVRLEDEWCDFEEMTKAIHAYETKATAEARFVYALDKIMPMMLIYIHDGYTWKQEGITLEMLDRVKRTKIELSPEILPYFEQLYELLCTHPDIIKPS